MANKRVFSRRARVNDVTRLLDEMVGGDAAAGEQLIALVYADLRRMAAQRMGPHGDGGAVIGKQNIALP